MKVSLSVQSREVPLSPHKLDEQFQILKSHYLDVIRYLAMVHAVCHMSSGD